MVISTHNQKDMVEELRVGHPGIVSVKELARSYLWWPNVDLEVEQTVTNCSSCQQVRKPPAAAPLASWMWPSNPWHHIHIDFAEDEKRHYFILVDAHSRWPTRVAPYHAASNGLAERMVQSFKNHMKACKGSKLSIQRRTENFLLTYQSTKHPTTGRTPASLFLGRELRTRLSLLCPNVGEKVLDSQAKQKATDDVRR